MKDYKHDGIQVSFMAERSISVCFQFLIVPLFRLIYSPLSWNVAGIECRYRGFAESDAVALDWLLFNVHVEVKNKNTVYVRQVLILSDHFGTR